MFYLELFIPSHLIKYLSIINSQINYKSNWRLLMPKQHSEAKKLYYNIVKYSSHGIAACFTVFLIIHLLMMSFAYPLNQRFL